MSDTSAYIQRFELISWQMFLTGLFLSVNFMFSPFCPKAFPWFRVTVDVNVELLGSIHPSCMSQATYSFSAPPHPDMSSF